MAHLFNFPVTRIPVTLRSSEVSQELSQEAGSYLVRRSEKIVRWAVLRVQGRLGLLQCKFRESLGTAGL